MNRSLPEVRRRAPAGARTRRATRPGVDGVTAPQGAATPESAADATERPPADLVELGTVRGAYGLRGWVRVVPLAGEGEVLRSVRGWWLLGARHPARRLSVTACRRHGSALVARCDGIATPEAADRLKGHRVAVARSDFPPAGEGQVYWVDLIGARVVNRQGDELGVVSAIRNHGAQDLLEVRAQGAVRLVPIVASYVDEVDVPSRLIRVDWHADW